MKLLKSNTNQLLLSGLYIALVNKNKPKLQTTIIPNISFLHTCFKHLIEQSLNQLAVSTYSLIVQSELLISFTANNE